MKPASLLARRHFRMRMLATALAALIVLPAKCIALAEYVERQILMPLA